MIFFPPSHEQTVSKRCLPLSEVDAVYQIIFLKIIWSRRRKMQRKRYVVYVLVTGKMGSR